jgi:hypothetical protein
MSFSIPSLPSIPNIPGLGLPTLPTFDIPSLPQLPSIPSLGEIKGAGDLAKITSTIPGLSGLNNLCGFSLPQIDIYFAMAVLKALAKGRLPGALAAKLGAGQQLLNKLKQYRTVAETLISLQQDLANLNVKDPVAVNEFLKRWGPRLPPGQAQDLIRQFTEAVDKGLNFDICSLVPNLNITQEGILKVLSKNSPTPKENPPDAEVLTPTVDDSAAKPSFNQSGVAYSEYIKWQTVVQPQLVTALAPLTTAINTVKGTDAYNTYEKISSLTALQHRLLDYAEACAFAQSNLATTTHESRITSLENTSARVQQNPLWQPYMYLVGTMKSTVRSNAAIASAYAEWNSPQLTPFEDKVVQGL